MNILKTNNHLHYLVLYKTAYVVCCLLCVVCCVLFVVVNYAPLSSPKPNKVRQWDYVYRPKINYSRPSANFYFEIFRKSPLFSPKCVK